MAEEESKKVEAESPAEAAKRSLPEPAPPETEAPKDVCEEKPVVPSEPQEYKVDDPKALAVSDSMKSVSLTSLKSYVVSSCSCSAVA